MHLLVVHGKKETIQQRRQLDNVVELDALARSFFVDFCQCPTTLSVPSAVPVLAFFDYATAFSSIAHQWLMAVLFIMGVPDGLLDFIKSIYFLNSTSVRFGEACVFLAWIFSGVLQGCPLSGSLFVI